MTESTEQTTAELIAELNADLRARDPLIAMQQQVRLKRSTRCGCGSASSVFADDTHAETYRRVEAILADLAQPALASR